MVSPAHRMRNVEWPIQSTPARERMRCASRFFTSGFGRDRVDGTAHSCEYALNVSGRSMDVMFDIASRIIENDGAQPAATKVQRLKPLKNLERAKGFDPRPRPWQGRALPLSYTRIRCSRPGKAVRKAFAISQNPPDFATEV